MKHHSEKEKKEDEIEISFDYKKVQAFFKKYGVYFLILIPIIISIFLRVQPLYLNTLDTYAESNTDNFIMNVINSEIDSAYPNLPDSNKDILIQQKYDEVIASGYISYQGQTINLDQVTEQNADMFKSNFQNDEGTTYLLAIDPYYYFRYYSNLINTGHIGFEQVNETEWDSYRMAPLGSVASSNFHIYFSAFVYKAWSFIDSDVDPMKVFFLIPMVVFTLSIIPAFFIGKRIAGTTGALFGSIMLAVSPAALTRTVAGFSDTDAYNILFPLLVTWFFLEMLKSENKKIQLSVAALGGLCLGLFSYAWQGWWYIFDFTLIISFAYLVYLLIMKRKDIKHISYLFKDNKIKYVLLSVLTYFVSTGIFVSIFTSFKDFTNFAKAAIDFTLIKSVGVVSLWPNIQTTVAELNEVSLSTIIIQMGMGTTILFFIALVGLVLEIVKEEKLEHSKISFLSLSFVYYLILMWIQHNVNSFVFIILAALPIAYAYYSKKNIVQLLLISSFAWYAALIKLVSLFESSQLVYLGLLFIPVLAFILISLWKNYEINIVFTLLMTIWFLGTIYASTKGVRFLLIMVPVFSISFGVGISLLCDYFALALSKAIDFNKNYMKLAIIGLFFALLLIAPIRSSYGTSLSEMPSMNDQWYGTLDKINQEASEDAIINSWWDFGHWFITIGQRGVTFDGLGQDRHMAHWVGKSLLVDDEKTTLGILRMVDCGNNNAFWTLDGYLNDTVTSIDILNELIVLNKDEAKTKLLNYVDEEQAEEVLQFTHCIPPDNYYITSADMVGKAGVWAHFGSWDFEKSNIVNLATQDKEDEAISFIMDTYDILEVEAKDMYDEVIALGTGRDANTWIAPWPNYASGLSSCSVSSDYPEMIVCQNGVLVNMTSKDAVLQTQAGLQYPASLTFINTEGRFEEITYDSSNQTMITNQGRKLSIALIPSGTNAYQSILLDEDLASSTFNRLFYYNGHDMECFDVFNDVTDITGARIITWEVDWECESANEVYTVVYADEIVEETITDETTE